MLVLAVDIEAALSTRVGGTFAISTAAQEITQQWVHSIVDTSGELAGMRYNSRLAGDPCLTLIRWGASGDADAAGGPRR